MKKNLHTVTAVFVIIVVSIILRFPVFAAEARNTANFPVKITFSSNVTDKYSHFVIELLPQNPENPMPEGTKNGVKHIIATNSGTVEFGKIVFTAPGEYRYTIRQVPSGESGVTYDDAVYDVIVQVSSAHGDLSAATWIISGTSGVKDDAAFFNNLYDSTLDPDYPPTNPYDTKAQSESDGNAPQTGNESKPEMFVALFALSVAGLFVTLIAKKHSQTAVE